MLKIGDFSKLARISIKMLRHYDSIGLLVPAETDPFNGYRYYAEGQLPLAGRINALKAMGFGLTAIKEILEQYTEPETLRNYLLIKHAELQCEKEEVQARMKLIGHMIEKLGKDDTAMEYQVTLKELPKRQVASVRQVIPSYKHEGELWKILRDETAHLKLQQDSPCYRLAVFHDKGFQESNVDIEIQMSVKGDYPNTEHVTFQTVDAVQIASTTYQGRYDQISEVNQVIANWVKDNGYEFNGLFFCIYHVSPYETSNPEEFVTEVCYPVRKR